MNNEQPKPPCECHSCTQSRISPFKLACLSSARTNSTLGETAEKLVVEVQELSAKLALAKEALSSIEALSHSWVIVEATARIEGPIHDRYRARAREALEQLE